MASNKDIAAFRRAVWSYYKKSGRNNLPWRTTTDPYKILVSEVMLQQTQVPRVIEKYKEFLKAFPNVRALARAPLSDVLKVWSGLGYNRRGKYLHDAAQAIVEAHKGKVPKDIIELRKLSGMGPYTASAVRVFAFDLPDVLIETNVRAAFIHHFFADKKDVSDLQLLPFIKEAAEIQDPRKWHCALMDYGVHIKKLHKNPARKSKHYAKQSKFEGSLRQVRGEILRQLHAGEQPKSDARLSLALKGLERDGLVNKEKGKWRIA